MRLRWFAQKAQAQPLWRRTSARPESRSTIAQSAPAICLDTRRFADQHDISPWLFCASKLCACSQAVLKSGQLLASQAGEPLPLPNGNQARCKCVYKLQPNRRKASRRQKDERRTDVRFEPNKLERQKNGRRKSDQWDRLRP